MGKTGSISDIEQRCWDNIVELKLRDKQRRLLSKKHARREESLQKVADFFKEAIGKGDYAAILKLDKIVLDMEYDSVFENTGLTPQSQATQIKKIDDARRDNRYAAEDLDLIQNHPEEYLKRVQEDLGADRKINAPPTGDRCRKYVKEQSFRLGANKGSLRSPAESTLFQTRQDALKGLDKHYKNMQHKVLGLKIPILGADKPKTTGAETAAPIKEFEPA